MVYLFENPGGAGFPLPLQVGLPSSVLSDAVFSRVVSHAPEQSASMTATHWNTTDRLRMNTGDLPKKAKKITP